MSRGGRNARERLLALIDLQGGLCGLCNLPINDPDEANIDHVVPRKHGGPNTLDNLQAAHTACNTLKGGGEPLSACLGCRRVFRSLTLLGDHLPHCPGDAASERMREQALLLERAARRERKARQPKGGPAVLHRAMTKAGWRAEGYRRGGQGRRRG